MKPLQPSPQQAPVRKPHWQWNTLCHHVHWRLRPHETRGSPPRVPPGSATRPSRRHDTVGGWTSSVECESCMPLSTVFFRSKYIVDYCWVFGFAADWQFTASSELRWGFVEISRLQRKSCQKTPPNKQHKGILRPIKTTSKAKDRQLLPTLLLLCMLRVPEDVNSSRTSLVAHWHAKNQVPKVLDVLCEHFNICWCLLSEQVLMLSGWSF